jgi:hypothetical protein
MKKQVKRCMKAKGGFSEEGVEDPKPLKKEVERRVQRFLDLVLFLSFHPGYLVISHLAS